MSGSRRASSPRPGRNLSPKQCRTGVERMRLRSPHSRWLGSHPQVVGAVEVGRGEGAGDGVAVAQAQEGTPLRRPPASRRRWSRRAGVRARRSPRAAARAPRSSCGRRASVVRAGVDAAAAHRPVASASSTSTAGPAGSRRSAPAPPRVAVQIGAHGRLARRSPQPDRARAALDVHVRAACGRDTGGGDAAALQAGGRVRPRPACGSPGWAASWRQSLR